MNNIKNDAVKVIEVKPSDLHIKSQKNRTQKVRSNPSKNIQPNLLKKKLLDKLRNHKLKSNPFDSPIGQTDSDETTNSITTNSTLKSAIKKPAENSLPKVSNDTTSITNKAVSKPRNKNKFDMNNSPDSLNNAFNESILLLKELENKRKSSKHNNTPNSTLPDTKDNVSTPVVASNVEISSEKFENNTSNINTSVYNNEPKYGCLKNGSKPTYRQWKRCTQKYTGDSPTKIILGKKNKIVSVLIPNKNTRKNTNREINVLHNKKLSEMRSYLKKNCLLKSGSHAPADVIRKIYEQSTLTGLVNNTNTDNLVHNYMAE